MLNIFYLLSQQFRTCLLLPWLPPTFYNGSCPQWCWSGNIRKLAPFPLIYKHLYWFQITNRYSHEPQYDIDACNTCHPDVPMGYFLRSRSSFDFKTNPMWANFFRDPTNIGGYFASGTDNDDVILPLHGATSHNTNQYHHRWYITNPFRIRYPLRWVRSWWPSISRAFIYDKCKTLITPWQICPFI